MSALEFWSGIALLAGAATVLSPLWWPPIRDEIQRTVSDARRFWATVPARRERAMSHWRGTEEIRRKAAVFLLLFVVGSAWTAWVCRNGAPSMAVPSLFELIFFAIATGAFLTGLYTGVLLVEIVGWVWVGFWGRRATVPAANPMNRVGEAAPLGEARFARAREVDAALAGRSDDFVPPKFRS